VSKGSRDGEEKSVAIVTIFRPLQVRLEVCGARLYFDDQNFSTRPDCHQFNASTCHERQFRYRTEFERAQTTRRTALDRVRATYADSRCEGHSNRNFRFLALESLDSNVLILF